MSKSYHAARSIGERELEYTMDVVRHGWDDKFFVVAPYIRMVA